MDKELEYGFSDDGIEFGHVLSDILMRIYIGPERDTTDTFQERATRLLKTIGVRTIEDDERLMSADILQDYLTTEYMWGL